MRTSHLALTLLLVLGTAPMLGCDSDDNDSNTNQNGGNNGGNNGGEVDPNAPFTQLIKSEKARAESTISDADLKAFVKGQYDLNYDILRKSGDDIAKENAMISIYSIQTALAMVYAGAAGDTADEMKEILNYGDHAHEALNKLDTTIMALNRDAEDKPDWGLHVDPIEIKTSNNLYLSPIYTWSSAWLDELATNYNAGITAMNFAADPNKARDYINGVVSDDTNKRIQDLIPENGITGDTKLVVTNAIYFKAPWDEGLKKSNKPIDFIKADGSKVKANVLNDSRNLKYAKGADYQAVVEPMRDDLFEIMFILPDEGKFDLVMNSMNGEKILGIFDALTTDKEVVLKFPMYTFTTELDVAQTLKSMGMNKAFMGADFSKMTEGPNGLYISMIRHKSFIAVDEKGIEAAAATAVAMEDGIPEVPENPIVLTLDHAFMFVIYETQTHTPLFVGHVMDPTEGK